MVFNPTFEGSIRFDQPVAPGPTGAEVLANIVGGLGVFDTIANARQGPGAPDNLTESWQRYSQETGAPRNIADATSADLRGFAGFDPARADDAISLNEQLGLPGFTSEREQRDTANEYLTSARGQVADALSYQLYPNDPDARAAYLAESQLNYAAEQAGLQRIQDRAAEATARGTIRQEAQELSDEQWDIVQYGLRENANVLARGLVELAPAILSNPGGVPVDSLPPEIQQMIPAGISSITQNNIQLIGQQFIQSLVREAGRGLGVGQRDSFMRDPSQEYINDTFTMFTNTIEEIANATDPTAALQRLTDTNQFNFESQLSEESSAVLAAYRALPNDPAVMAWFQGQLNASGIGTDVANDFLRAIQTGLAPDPARLSEDEGRQLYEMGAIGLQAIQNGSRDATGAPGMLSAMVAGAERASGSSEARLGDDVYDLLLDPSVLNAVRSQPGGEEAIAELGGLFINDFTFDISNIQQQLEGIGSLVYQNGRFSIEMSEIVGDDGTSLGTGRAPSTANRLVRDLNTRLEELGPSGLAEVMGPEFEAILSEAQLEGPATRGGVLTTPEVSETSNLLERVFPAGGLQTQGPPASAATPPGTNATQFAMSILREFEGFSEDTYWDVNAHRLGFGSDTITTADGRVRAVVQGDRVSREDAERDLARRVQTEFLPMARNGVGPQFFDNLTTEQQGVLTSLSYNYGNEWNGDLVNVTRAIRSGDMVAAEQAIRALGSHNDGINMRRRNREADIFMRESSFLPSGQPRPPQTNWVSNGQVQVLDGVYINRGIAVNGQFDASFDMTNASRLVREGAAERMQNETLPRFRQMQQYFGAFIPVNDAMAQAGTSRENGTTNSRHFFGDALDLSLAGMSNEDKIRAVRAAYLAGFRGFGFSEGMLHIDLGSPRSWAYGNSTFAGMPVSEVQAMVANGTFPDDMAPLFAGDVEWTTTLAPTPEAIARFGSVVGDEADPDVGDPGNFQTYTPNEPSEQEVEQGGDSSNTTVTPEQSSQTAAAAAARQQGAPVDAEVQELITALTDGASEQELEAIRAALRALQGETRR